VSEPLVRLVIGAKWIAAVPVIQLLCISMPLRMLNSFTGAAVTAVGRQDVNIKSLLLAIVVVPACVIVGSRWGVSGVAAAWAIGFPLVYLFNASLVQRTLKIPIRDMFVAVWPSALAATAMIAATQTLSAFYLNSLPPLAHLAVALPFAVAVFLATLWVVSRRAALEMLDFARGVVSQKP
jgi:O-antigen/teichoic acid export membrane protein